MKIFTACFLSLAFLTVQAQLDSSRSIRLQAFADGFYVYAPDKSSDNKLYPFLYNYNRNRNLRLNHTWVKLSVASRKVRSNLALHAGTYAQDNYADEPEWAKVLSEANVGVVLNHKKTVWFDVGVIPSHIGFEGAGSLTNWALTRSLIAENSPYYLNGAKLTWTPTPTWELALLAFNGWQRIYQSGRVVPATGWQVRHEGEKSVFNWSTFMGGVQTETTTRFRFFNNLYYQVNLTSGISLIADVDVGIQSEAHYTGWWGAAVITRFKLNEQLSAAGRIEYYSDKHGLVTNFSRLVAGSFSFNADYKPMQAVALRAECRRLMSQKPLNIGQPEIRATTYVTIAVLAQVDFFSYPK